MALIDYTRREIQLKLVYYGPAFAGKTTSLKSILRSSKRDQESLTNLQTGPDRTLFSEYSPPALPPLRQGFATRLLLYTVPGRVQLNTPRQLVLRDVDGIVFVADPQWSRVEANVQALENLEENLARLGRPLADVPLVLQFNKQDLPGLARPDYLEFLLNRHSVPPRPVFRTTASEDQNVLPCLEALTGLAVERFQQEH